VFAGGSTLEAAEAVGSDEAIAQAHVLGLLGQLIAKSLVVADVQSDGAMRYRLLETVRVRARSPGAGA
jgi:predicted ATPase